MIKINLLPEERRRSEVPAYKFLLAGTYLVTVVTVLFWAYSLFMFKYAENKLADVQNQISSLHVWQERYDLNQVQNAEINKRNNIVKEKLKERLLWSNSLAELGNVTPYGCWLLNVTQNKAKTSEITIKGKSLNMENILDFINRLQKDPTINSVDLLDTKLSKAANSAGSAVAIDFSLKVHKSEVGKK
ncbi:MAG: PilN domain-containing protein [Acidaminococcaceae bacterium]